jgi:hypothetical protein
MKGIVGGCFLIVDFIPVAACRSPQFGQLLAAKQNDRAAGDD